MEPEERIAELEDRIEQLEREQQSDTDMTRRDTLKTGAAALGLGGLIGGGAGAAATGTARAGTDQTGTWGSPGNPQDWYVEDLYDGAGNIVASAEGGALTGTELQYESVTTKELSNTHIVGPNGYDSIQLAHDDLPPEGGLIKIRKDIQESDITLTKEVKLEGVTSGGRYPDAGTEGSAVIDASGGSGIIIKEQGIVLSDIHLTGNKSAGSIGVDCRTGASSLKLDNVTAHQFETGYRFADAFFSDVKLFAIDNDQDGVLFEPDQSTDFCNGMTGDIISENNGRDGLRIDFSAGSAVSGNSLAVTAENNAGYGYNVVSGSHVDNHLFGYGFEKNTTGSIRLDGGNRQTLAHNIHLSTDPVVNSGELAYTQGEDLNVYGFGRVTYLNGANYYLYGIGRLKIKGLENKSNASPSDLDFYELALDDNRGGTGNYSLLFKDTTGTVHYWDAGGTL